MGSNNYKNIIDHPHYQSKKRPHMSMEARAAHFSPFAALTGFESAIEETARLTDDALILDDSVIEEINAALREINARLDESVVADITFFVKDNRKDGGSYTTVREAVKKVNDYDQTIQMQSGLVIPLSDIINIEIVS